MIKKQRRRRKIGRREDREIGEREIVTVTQVAGGKNSTQGMLDRAACRGHLNQLIVSVAAELKSLITL